MPDLTDAEAMRLGDLVARLSQEFEIDTAFITWAATIVAERYAGARIRSYVPILAERDLREMLRRHSQSGAAVPAFVVAPC